MSENYNMSLRKFLKQVGVTSQQAIESALRDAGNGQDYTAKMVLIIEGLELEHVVEGTLKIEAQG
ncbi:MAG: DUF6494 family protein [Paracoccaceae bacterium]